VVWHVRIRRAVPGSWPKSDVWEYTAHSSAQLPALSDGARRDPAVLAFPYTQRRELVGDEPDHCQRGHLYAQPGHPYPAVDRRWFGLPLRRPRGPRLPDLPGRLIDVIPAPQPPPASRPGRRRRLPWILLVVAIVLIGCGLAAPIVAIFGVATAADKGADCPSCAAADWTTVMGSLWWNTDGEVRAEKNVAPGHRPSQMARRRACIDQTRVDAHRYPAASPRTTARTRSTTTCPNRREAAANDLCSRSRSQPAPDHGEGPRNISVSRAFVVVAGTGFEPVTSGL
jgi:hypothetical protein